MKYNYILYLNFRNKIKAVFSDLFKFPLRNSHPFFPKVH